MHEHVGHKFATSHSVSVEWESQKKVLEKWTRRKKLSNVKSIFREVQDGFPVFADIPPIRASLV